MSGNILVTLVPDRVLQLFLDGDSGPKLSSRDQRTVVAEESPEEAKSVRFACNVIAFTCRDSGWYAEQGPSVHGSTALISGGNEWRIVWKAMRGERMLLQHTTAAADQKCRFKFIKYPPCSPELCPPEKKQPGVHPSLTKERVCELDWACQCGSVKLPVLDLLGPTDRFPLPAVRVSFRTKYLCGSSMLRRSRMT